MATFVSKDGQHTITTSHPGEQVSLRAQGYQERAAAKPAPRPAKPAQAAGESTK